jgi:hypothetical protein
MDTTYRAAKRAEISARRAANDSFLATTARDEIAFGRSELAVSAFYGMRTAYSRFFDAAIEPSVDGHSPYDFGQTERLNHVLRNDHDCAAALARSSVRLHAATKRARTADKHGLAADALMPAVVDAIYSSGVARDSGVRNTRDICDYLAGRVVVDGDLPLPVPTVDLSLVIRDLPDRQRSVAKRLMAGDSAADIARADGVNRSSVCRSMDKIRRALLAADPSLCPA